MNVDLLNIKNINLPSPDKVYDALFGNLFGFIILIVVIAFFVGIIIYRQVNPPVKG